MKNTHAHTHTCIYIIWIFWMCAQVDLCEWIWFWYTEINWWRPIDQHKQNKNQHQQIGPRSVLLLFIVLRLRPLFWIVFICMKLYFSFRSFRAMRWVNVVAVRNAFVFETYFSLIPTSFFYYIYSCLYSWIASSSCMSFTQCVNILISFAIIFFIVFSTNLEIWCYFYRIIKQNIIIIRRSLHIHS